MTRAEIDPVPAWLSAPRLRADERPDPLNLCSEATAASSARAAALGLDVERATERATNQGFVLTVEQANDLGVGAAVRRRLVRRAIWTVPRRGVLAVLPPDEALRPVLAATAATLAKPGSVISHESAAALHGLPVRFPPARPRLTSRQPNGAGGRPDVRVHGAALRLGDIQSWAGAPVTSAPRTVFDISRSSGRAAGLVAADAALRRGLTTRAELSRAAGPAARWPGVIAAREVARLADPAAESPLESLTRLCLLDGGVPAPTLQLPIATRAGWFRADFGWDEFALVLEADGQLKYASGQALWDEKRRQDAIEAAGYRVLRVGWTDVTTRPELVVAQVLAAMHAARRRTSG